MHTEGFELKLALHSEKAQKARFNLSGSYSQVLTLDELSEWEPELIEKISHTSLAYPEVFGCKETRELIAARYSNTDMYDVVLTNGVDDVWDDVFSAVLQPADRVVVLTPTYAPLLKKVAQYSGEIARWDAREEMGWEPDIEQLKLLLRKPTRAVVFSCPGNPTGWLPDLTYARKLVRVAEEAGAIIIADEIYSGLLAQGKYTSFLDLSEGAVVVDSLSKSFGLPGLRVGWMITRNKKIMETVLELRSFKNSYVSCFSEIVASAALRHELKIRTRSRKILLKNWDVLKNVVQELPAKLAWDPSNPSLVAYVKWKGTGTAAEFADRFYNDVGGLIVHNGFFDHEANYFRLGLGTRRLPENLGKFRDYIASKY